MQVEVIDPVADYLAVMRELFDFDLLRGMFARGFTMRVDAMNAVGGPMPRPFWRASSEHRPGTVVNATPLEDFGGLHPDPNPVNAEDLIKHMMRSRCARFWCRVDGDADRNMVVGRNFVVTPVRQPGLDDGTCQTDSRLQGGLAGCGAVHAHLGGGGPCGQSAWDWRVMKHPLGWKFFGNLLDAGRVTLCGEESYGTGSSHVREKMACGPFSGSVCRAATGRSVESLVREHWRNLRSQLLQSP
jgi:phosphoglucomutase